MIFSAPNFCIFGNLEFEKKTNARRIEVSGVWLYKQPMTVASRHGDLVARWLRRLTRDQEIAGSTFGRFAAVWLID